VSLSYQLSAVSGGAAQGYCIDQAEISIFASPSVAVLAMFRWALAENVRYS